MKKQNDDDFPHGGFPYRLEYVDGKDKKTCWFQCEDHLEKHITRYKLDLNKVTIKCQDASISFIPPIQTKKRGRKPKQQLFSTVDSFFKSGV